MKQYTSLWLVCLLAVFSMTARAQEGIETKARPDYPALPFMLTFEAPAEGSASLSISADGETLTSPTTLHSGTEVTITVTPADGYRMASGYPKVYRTGTPSETVPATFKPDASSGIAYLYTFTMPDFPVTVEVEYEKIQSTVTFANPANGTLTLSTADAPGSSIVSGGEVASGTKVTIAATPNKGYQMVFGSLKVSGKVGDKTNTVPLQKEKDGTTYFLMPAYTVEAEVKLEPILVALSSEARLSSLSYKEGSGEVTPLPGFLASTMKYEVLLPNSTQKSATLTLSGQLVDAKAELLVNGSPVSVEPTGSFTATVSLESGSAKATLVVTAEDGQTKRTYEVNFTVLPESEYYVKILQPEGGTISVSYTKEGKEVSVKSGDAVPVGTELSLAHTALPKYEFVSYKVNDDPLASGNITVSGTDDLTITATFKLQSPVIPEEIGTPAVPKEKEGQEGTNVPTDDNPIVIIPDAVSLPSDTELSSLRLVKEDIEDPAKKAEIEEKAEAAAQDAGIAPDAPKIVMEVTLVKVTTTISATDASTTTAVTPVQPSDIVTVRIPYPEGVNKTQHDIVIIHLRSDGVVDVYSEGNNNLTLEDDYMEISVASFSPFVVSYTPKSGPVDPDYPDTPDTPDTPDVPTSNASVEGGIAVWTSANALHIRADRPAEAWVVGLSGASRARFAVVPGETRHALPAGVYLVRIADQTYKVRIRN
uniref:InlB B-repeat-containing protein n=1 Tax=Parabacteroides distasonis TaxID=823 RepID=UPI003FF04C4B